MAKAAAVFVVLLSALLVCLTFNSIPAVGTVSGICLDAKTGQPVSGASVDIEIDQPDNDGSSDEYYGPRHASGADLFSALPTGWSQGSQSDTSLDFAGHDSTPRTRWSVISGDDGRFYARSVTAGTYTISADCSGFTSGTVSLAVSEQPGEPVVLKMLRSGDSLDFDTPGRYWATSEVPSIGLNGTLSHPSIVLGIYRLDLNKAVALCPKLFLQNQQLVDASDVPQALVRKWPMQIQDADDGGSFYDQIHCNAPSGSPLPAGLYQLTATTADKPHISTTVIFLVTDLAVAAKQWGDNLLLHTVDLTTGRSAGSLNCWCVYDNNDSDKALSRGVSAVDGLCLLSTKNAAPETQGIALTRRGNSVAALQIGLNSPGTTDDSSGADTSATPHSRDLRSFIYTDRPVYRPGSLVQFKGITRWYQPGTGFIVPAGTKFTIQTTDAQGTIVNRQTLTANKYGAWHGSFILSDDALTGGYTVTETCGNQTATGSFAVAAYHKPEYQVSLSFDKVHYVRGETITATIKAAYYFGAPMSGASGSVDFSRKSSSPGDDDEDDSSDSGDFLESDVIKLDGNGEAVVTLATGDQDPAAMQMTYTASAFIDDKSGGSATSQATVVVAQGDFSITATPSSTIAAVGDQVTVDVQAIDAVGRPLKGKQLTAKSSYDVWQNGNDIKKPIASAAIVTGSDGTANWVVSASKAGLIDVDVSGVDTRGNTVTCETQIWVPDKDYDIQAEYTDLSVTLGKPRYQPGDVAKVLITTEHPGPDALVTVEGTSLYRSMVVRLSQRATEVDIPVVETYAPGVTIAVNSIVNKQYLSSSATLVIDDPQRKLNVIVKADRSKYHPGDKANVNILTADSKGRPVSADVSLAVVDEAIFSIMPEPAGTIEEAFLPQQDDDVVSSDSTETVYYGDVDKGSTQIDIRKRFPDTALWLPDIITDRSGEAHVSLNLPDNLTTWRITCYGQTLGTMVGKGVGEMVVNKDLSVSLEAPSFMVDGDHSTLIAMVHNDTDRPLTTHLTLTAAGLDVVGEMSQDFTVQPGSPTRIAWPITATSTGAFSQQATVQSGSLNDGVLSSFDVLAHGAQYVTWNAGCLTTNAMLAAQVNPHFLRTNSSLTIRLSPTLASALPPAATYLSEYPYGSSDSTISALVADATLYSSKNALNLATDARNNVRQKAVRALLRAYQQQGDDGGWGWFSTDPSDCWMTAYAAYGLTLARSSGLPVNPAIMTAAVKATASLCNTERAKNPKLVDVSAIALSALVLSENGSGKAAEDAGEYLLRRWTRAPRTSNNGDVATVAIAELLLGTSASKVEAQHLMAQLWSVGRETGAMLSWTEEYHSNAAAAGEYLPDSDATAWALLAAQTITPGDPRIDEAARWLVSNRNDDHWNSVDSTGIAVLALAKYLEAQNELSPSFTAKVVVNNKLAGTVHFTPSTVGDPDDIITIPGSSLLPGGNLIEISKVGQGRLYYSVKLSQMLAVASPAPPPPFLLAEFEHLLHPQSAPQEPASGYRIKRVYMRLTSRRNFLWEDSVPKAAWSFENGDSILVRLIIDCRRPGSRIVIDEPVPAGCRIGEVSGEFEENWDNWWDYTDVRDHDIVFFVSDMTTGEQEIDYHLVANREGEYDVMPTDIGSMVDPTLQAEGMASKVQVYGE